MLRYVPDLGVSACIRTLTSLNLGTITENTKDPKEAYLFQVGKAV